MVTPTSMLAATLVALRLVAGFLAPGQPAYGTYAWPVQGPVIRGFEPPPNPYASGHRGIDIAVPYGTLIVAPLGGTVAFAGSVAGSLFISIDHPDGVRTTYSWLSSIAVKKGDVVTTGSPIGATGWGHPGVTPPHLHFGARVGSDYLDPMLLLVPQSVVDIVHLAPLAAVWVSPDAPWPVTPRMSRLATPPTPGSSALAGRRFARPPHRVRCRRGLRAGRLEWVAGAPGRA
jgi:murein DD-endopeptidase MepM/ murein hydrolase activator NlpD